MIELWPGLSQVDCDPAGVHQYFQHLPEPFPLQQVITRGLNMFQQLPPDALIAIGKPRIDPATLYGSAVCIARACLMPPRCGDSCARACRCG